MKRGQKLLAGVDTGGTFTDVITSAGTVAKVLTNKVYPLSSVEEGLRRFFGSIPIDTLAHGTTVATNALLERKGAPTALITNEGMADLIEIGRQTRPDLYDHFADPPRPLVPRELRFEIACRLGPSGEELAPLRASDVEMLCSQLEAVKDRVHSVAVSFLHSYINPSHERAVRDALVKLGYEVSISSDISPEYREFQRTSTVVANAYLQPVLRPYIAGLTSLASWAFVMTSAGGLLPARQAAQLPAALLLSGPVAGAIAGAVAASACGFDSAVTLDMGGTSTDICMIAGGLPQPTALIEVGGFPIRLPSVEILTIGAGGGSIAWIDPGGALRVGPQSAGADPGPACYGRGGEDFTVTDANLVAGRIPKDHSFPELGPVDLEAAKEAMSRVGVEAEDVLAVVNANMERALRTATAQRGYDPARLALVAFGGAGPLHACDLAHSLGMRAVVVPPHAGVFSAVGLLVAPVMIEVVRSRPDPLEHDSIKEEMTALAGEAARTLEEWGFSVKGTSARIDCRYKGQSHELSASDLEDFHKVHRMRNGYARPELPIEVTALRARAWAEPLGQYDELTAGVERKGPVVGRQCIMEEDCTIFVPSGWIAEVHSTGAFVIRRS